jgi:hypothetical protein
MPPRLLPKLSATGPTRILDPPTEPAVCGAAVDLSTEMKKEPATENTINRLFYQQHDANWVAVALVGSAPTDRSDIAADYRRDQNQNGQALCAASNRP